MTYQIIQTPFTVEFSRMSKDELREYLHWFLQILPERVLELAGAVRATPGFEAWTPDDTPSSLDPLGQWFVSQVETRPRTAGELQQIREGLPYPIEVSANELTKRTFSLATDVGMYLGRALLHNRPGLRWDQPLGDKRNVDYGQIVLRGSGPVPLNPIRITVNIAYGASERQQLGGRLRQLYDIWFQNLMPEP